MYVNVVVCGACCEQSERLKTVRVSVAWAWYREWARWYWKLGSFFCVIYSQFSRSMGSLGHCWVIGASVATKKNTNQVSQSKQKANQVLIQCTQEVIELVSSNHMKLTSREHLRDPRSCQSHHYRRSWKLYQWGNHIHGQHPPGRCSTCGNPRDVRDGRRSRHWPTHRQRDRRSHWQPL